LPGVVAQAFLLFGESYTAPAVVAFAFAALLVAVVVSALAQLEGRKHALLAGLVLCSTPCFPTFAANQQSDIPLALYFFAAAALLELGRGRFRTLVLAGFAAGLCAWTKNEGTIFIGCVGFGLFVFRREALRPFALGALPGFALLVAFKLLVAPPSPLTEPGLLGRLVDPQRWLVLLADVARRLVYFQAFGLWLLAWIAALVVARKELRRSPLALALLLSYAACAGIYLGVPYPLHWIFKSSADRLFMQLWPSAILLTLPALRRATAHT
jgi:4-amino-4-deoxy-L-arabinose transferase-like glycosyltransferase